MKNITLSDIEAMEKLARVQFANTLPGPKPIALVGSINRDGETNLAPFSSVTHLGSNPALIGLVSRPDLVDRHTLSNILDTRSYTINHIHSGILEKAHHCSARYPRGISEFTTSGLTPHFEPGTAATARLRETYPQSAHTFWDPENEACLPDLLITLLRPTVFQANLRTSQEIKFSQAM